MFLTFIIIYTHSICNKNRKTKDLPYCQNQIFSGYKIMTSIDRTAYPNLKATQIISQKTLTESYSLNTHELEYIQTSVRTNKLRLHFALQFKTFQNLGLFIEAEQVPKMIVNHLKRQLAVPHNLQLPFMKSTTLYRHRQSIRQYLGWASWGLNKPKSARRFAIQSAYKAAKTLNFPADIINVVIEELKINRFEIPAFSTLCRLVRHVRSRTNGILFQKTFDLLNHEKLIPTLDELLGVPEGKIHSPYQKLKEPPKSPRIKDFKEQIKVFVSGGQSNGIMEKEWNLVAEDSFSNFDRGISNQYAVELGLDYAIYQGGLMGTSRPFCEARNNKIFSRKEILKWANVDFQGKPKVYDPIVDLGGYRCRHTLDWISEELARKIAPEKFGL